MTLDVTNTEEDLGDGVTIEELVLGAGGLSTGPPSGCLTAGWRSSPEEGAGVRAGAGAGAGARLGAGAGVGVGAGAGAGVAAGAGARL